MSSETSAIRTQTPRNYPKRNKLRAFRTRRKLKNKNDIPLPYSFFLSFSAFLLLYSAHLYLLICPFFLFYFSSFSNVGIFCVLFTYSFPFIAYSSLYLSCHPVALLFFGVFTRTSLLRDREGCIRYRGTSDRVMQIIRTVMVATDRDECMISTAQTTENGISFQKIMYGQTV